MCLPLIRESAAILSRVGAMEELAISKICAARSLSEQNEIACEHLLVESLDISRDAECAFGIGCASYLLGASAFPQCADHRAVAYLQDALEAFRSIKHHRGTSWVLAGLASLI